MMTLEKVKNPGTVILPEGKVPKFFIMVKEGQFELSRRNLDSIYMNTETGQIKIKNGQSEVLSQKLNENIVVGSQYAVSKYVGSDLHIKVQRLLQNIKETDALKLSNLLKQKETNQPQTTCIKFATVGQGQLYGVNAVLHKRATLYELRSMTPNAQYYVIPASHFNAFIEREDLRAELLPFLKEIEVQFANKLVRSIQKHLECFEANKRNFRGTLSHRVSPAP